MLFIGFDEVLGCSVVILADEFAFRVASQFPDFIKAKSVASFTICCVSVASELMEFVVNYSIPGVQCKWMDYYSSFYDVCRAESNVYVLDIHLSIHLLVSLD